jgi:hypothetical protein
MAARGYGGPVAVCGPAPRKSIVNAKLEDAVQYGCRDADMTLRLALELDKLREEQMRKWTIQEGDEDQ